MTVSDDTRPAAGAEEEDDVLSPEVPLPLIDLSIKARFRRTGERELAKVVTGLARTFRAAPVIAAAAIKKLHARLNSRASAAVRQAKAEDRQRYAKRLAIQARENGRAAHNDIALYVRANWKHPVAKISHERLLKLISAWDAAGELPPRR